MSMNKYFSESTSPSPEIKTGKVDISNITTEKHSLELNVEQLLVDYTTINFTHNNKRIKIIFLRKSQRGNTIDSDFNIWSKSQAVDVCYETAHGRQDFSLQLVKISKENVKFNKDKSGEDSEDYLVMKSLYKKFGDCLLGQDGQQTFSVLNMLVRPFLPDDLKHNLNELKFKEEIKFEKEHSEEGKIESWSYPRKSQDSYVISDWPEHAKKNILSSTVNLTIYTKVLYSHIPKIFQNKNVRSSPNAAEIRTVSTNLVSWVSSFITATDDELSNRFQKHEKSIPLTILREKGKDPFVPMKKQFGSNMGDLFNKYIGNNLRMANEEFFQKILVCEQTKTQKWADKAYIVTAKHLDKLVKEDINKKNYREWKERLLYTIDNFRIMFEMFESHDNFSKNLSKRIGFITDLNNIISYIKSDITDYKVSYQLDGSNIEDYIRVELIFKNFKKFIELFVEEWNELVKVYQMKQDGDKLTDEELKMYDVIESTDSFQWKSIKRRTKYWEEWYHNNKDNFLEDGVLLVKDLNRFFSTNQRVMIAAINDYTNPFGEEINPIDVWNGKIYQTDHWYISYANGGFTCAFNAQVLKAKTNQKKGKTNAEDYKFEGVQ
tara:strand:- start:21133 stop:22944 length:1812 start_codon:yes stop_codon:yes gene_type:complete